MNWAIAIPAVVGSAGAVVFIATYSVVAPWWRSAAGWLLMLADVAVLLMFGYLSTRQVFGPFRHYEWVRTAVFGLAAAWTWGSVWLLVHTRRGKT